MAFWLHCGIIVCCPNEGDDEVFDRSQELWWLLVELLGSCGLEVIHTSSNSSARCKPSSATAGREGIEDPFVDMALMEILQGLYSRVVSTR
jgi:hypothetical protein